MAELSHAQYEQLERAVLDGRRIAIYRRGTEYIVIPRRLRVRAGKELIDAVHPTTGEAMEFFIDTIDRIEVIR